MTLGEKVVAWLGLQDQEIYLVGGCVRDRLLGRPVCDLDIAVDGDGLSLARRLADGFGGHYFPLDLARGTGRALLRGSGGQALTVDVARYRGADLAADLADRDFTINALAANVRQPTEVIDNHGGLSDLASEQIHPVSRGSIRNDPLRALRAVRLAAELGFSLTPEAENLVRRDGHLIESVSGERTRDELSRLLVCSQASASLSYLHDLGLLTAMIPELTALQHLAQPPPHHLDALVHSLTTVQMLEKLLCGLALTGAPWYTGETAAPEGGSSARGPWDQNLLAPFARRLGEHLGQSLSGDRSRLVTLKLAALLHDTGKPMAQTVDQQGRVRFLGHESIGADITARILRRLRYSNVETRLAEAIVRHHMRPLLLASQKGVSARAVYRFYRDTGDAGVDVLLHALADHRATYGPDVEDRHGPRLAKLAARMLHDYWDRKRERVAPLPIIGGEDLLRELELTPGPLIGELLEIVREAQASGEVTTRQEALVLVRAHLSTAHRHDG